MSQRDSKKRKIGWDDVLVSLPAIVVFILLVKGYAPLMVFIGLAAIAVISGIRFLLTMWRLLGW